jgi:hypothetical protein
MKRTTLPRTILCCLTAMILATASALSAPLPDAAAIALLNNQLNTQNTQNALLPIGTFVAQGDVNNWAAHRVSIDTYYFLLAAEGMGLLNVEKLPAEANAPALPDVFSQRIAVTLNDKGRALNQWKRPSQSTQQADVLALRISKTDVRHIVSNREITRPAGNFRIIAFTATEAPDEPYVELAARKYVIEREAGGPCLNCNTAPTLSLLRKHRIVLKRQKVGEAWKMVALDSAGNNDDFRTNYVKAYLEKLKR